MPIHFFYTVGFNRTKYVGTNNKNNDSQQKEMIDQPQTQHFHIIKSLAHQPPQGQLLLWSVELIYHIFEWRLWQWPLDGDAVTSPHYMRELLLLSLHLIEVSHISIRKSSKTLRCFTIIVEKSTNSIRRQR